MEFLKKIFLKIYPFLKPIFEVLLNAAGDILREIAIEAVTMVANDPDIVSNSDKRQKAFDTIKESLIEKGLNYRDSAINLSIEWAVAYLKESK